MKNMGKKEKKMIILSILGALLLLTGVGVAYSYITADVEMKEANIIVSGVLRLSLEEDTPISLLENYPITEEAGLSSKGFKFSLKNVGNLVADYEIYLDDITVDKPIPDNYLRYSLLKNGESKTGTNSVLLSSITGPNRLIDNGSIAQNGVNNYVLRIWIDETAPNSVQGSEYKARIRIESYQNDK